LFLVEAVVNAGAVKENEVLNRIKSNRLPLFGSLVLVAMSCGPAGYEILRPGKDGEKAGNPNPIVEDSSEAHKDNVPHNLPPSAGIEVMYAGKSVTKIKVGTPVTVRPTPDTMDADDYGRSSCANPGIVQADYDLGNDAKPVAKRTQGCEELGVPHTFAKTGIYKLGLVVLTNENEQATAAMSIIVYDGAEPDDGGFRVNAHPMIGTTADDITFDGICDSKKGVKAISWKFGDTKTGAGARVTHRYPVEGQYKVDAVCETTDGKTWEAQVTIVIIPGTSARPPKGPVPPLPVPPVKPPGTPGQNGPGQNGPGQQPGQTPGVKPTPVQGIPGCPTCDCNCTTWYM